MLGEERTPHSYPDVLCRRLEARALHRILLAADLPVRWPAWAIAAIIVLLLVAAGGIWWLSAGCRAALTLVSILAALTLGDLAILAALPRLRLSFGPVGSQLLLLQWPRFALAAFGGLVAHWLYPPWVLAAACLIEAAASLALAWAALVEPSHLELTRYELAVPWPKADPPLRLLHISDLHVERLGRREDRLRETVREAMPDLIVLTGDYVSLSRVDDPLAYVQARELLAQLHAPLGVYAVLGTPPVDRDAAPIFDGLHIRLLRDEVATVDVDQGRRLALIGLDCTHEPQPDAERLADVVAQAPPDALRVLLYHAPDLALVAPRYGIHLYLCGHTHGGQIRLPLIGALVTSSLLGKRFEMGYHLLEGMHLYVSRGVGLEGLGAPRLRFLCPPEVTLFIL